MRKQERSGKERVRRVATVRFVHTEPVIGTCTVHSEMTYLKSIGVDDCNHQHAGEYAECSECPLHRLYDYDDYGSEWRCDIIGKELSVLNDYGQNLIVNKKVVIAVEDPWHRMPSIHVYSNGKFAVIK